MKTTLFGAIYIGTYAVSLKIFEIKKDKIKRLESVRSRLDLEEEIIDNQHLEPELIDRLCGKLNDFRSILKEYCCDDFRVYGAPALFRLDDVLFIKGSIKKKCGMDVVLLSNSEHRLMTYKCVTRNPLFSEMLKDTCSIVNLGGGDSQITLFENGELQTTEHIMTGAVVLYDTVKDIPENDRKKRKIMEELIDKQLMVVKSRLGEKKVPNLILMGDFVMESMLKTREMGQSLIQAETFLALMKQAIRMRTEDLVEFLGVSDENAELLAPYMVMYKRIVELMDAKRILVPGVDILDGIGYSYALEKKRMKSEHDFQADVLSACRYMAKKYSSYTPHIEALKDNATLIFESMKTEHNMGGRELLLLQCAALLHDIGKYVSLSNAAEMSYHIILESEIIGLSHAERMITASIVKYNSEPLANYREAASLLSPEDYLIVARCAAIMRVANAIDRSHKQKFKKISAKLKDDARLVITIETEDDLLLERHVFDAKIDTFERVFSIRPVIRIKKDAAFTQE